MDLKGTWSLVQVRAIQRALKDWLTEENFHLQIYDVTTFNDSIRWFMVVLRKADGTYVQGGF